MLQLPGVKRCMGMLRTTYKSHPRTYYSNGIVIKWATQNVWRTTRQVVSSLSQLFCMPRLSVVTFQLLHRGDHQASQLWKLMCLCKIWHGLFFDIATVTMATSSCRAARSVRAACRVGWLVGCIGKTQNITQKTVKALVTYIEGHVSTFINKQQTENIPTHASIINRNTNKPILKYERIQTI